MSHPVCSSREVNTMNLPSRDQLLAYFVRGVRKSRSSTPAPLDKRRYRFRPPSRPLENTIQRPSGDHMGSESSLVSVVNRAGRPEIASSTHTSRAFAATSRHSTATWPPDGEISGL